MAEHINERVSGRSEPGLTGLSALGRALIGVARTAQADREAFGLGCESGELVAPRGGALAGCSGRELSVARLSAAADDAEELARGLAQDAQVAVASVLDAGPSLGGDVLAELRGARAWRCARLCFRLAVQASALRELADAVQAEAETLPEGLCIGCGAQRAQDITGRWCLACWVGGR